MKLLIKPSTLNSTGRNNNIKYVHTKIYSKPKCEINLLRAKCLRARETQKLKSMCVYIRNVL